METENQEQLSKWGIQERTLPEWMLFLTEEIGELAEAIGEFTYRNGAHIDVYNEAIQCATLSAKIAEMVQIQSYTPTKETEK
jgi:NTP pyrophosphatase (non-canonical NTP hydrolase)